MAKGKGQAASMVIVSFPNFENRKQIRIFVIIKTRAMTTKLTLTIEQDVIKVAKTYAHKKGRSLSDLIESYLKTLTAKTSNEEDLSPRVKKLKGTIKLPKDFDYKKTLADELIKKYSK